MGIVIAVGAVLVRFAMQRSNDQQLEEGQEQLRLLQMQIKQSKDERAVLDDQLPRGGGPMASRLAAAERELAALEDLAPLDSRHAAARQDADATARRAAQAEEDLRAARRAWRDGPGKGRPAARSSRRETSARWRAWPAASATCNPAFRSWTRNSASAAASATCSTAAWPNWWPIAASKVESQHPMEKVLELSEMLTRQEARIARRDVIRRRLRKLRHARAKGEEAIARLQQRRKQLLRQCGAESEEHLHRLVAEAARVENLRHEHEHIEHDLAATIGNAGFAGRLEAASGRAGRRASRRQPRRPSGPAGRDRERDSSADRKTRPAHRAK